MIVDSSYESYVLLFSGKHGEYTVTEAASACIWQKPSLTVFWSYVSTTGMSGLSCQVGHHVPPKVALGEWLCQLFTVAISGTFTCGSQIGFAVILRFFSSQLLSPLYNKKQKPAFFVDPKISTLLHPRYWGCWLHQQHVWGLWPLWFGST